MLLRFSVPVRHALSRLTLPVLMVAAFLLLLVGKADVVLEERLRMAVGDTLSPIYRAAGVPIAAVRGWVEDASRLASTVRDNAVLRDENEKLRKWQSIALALDAENEALKQNLHWIPDAAPAFVTAEVVADTGGIYARSVLVSVGPNHFVAKGQIALDDRGLVGRVTETGERAARILLITDLNSRIPVMLAASHAHAIMAGTNGERPRLLFLPQEAKPVEGERVVTSGEAHVYPANLPVGSVHLAAGNAVEVVPEARLAQIDVVRLFDYGLRGLTPPPAAGQPMSGQPVEAAPKVVVKPSTADAADPDAAPD